MEKELERKRSRMPLLVRKNNYVINENTKVDVSRRCNTVTKAVNKEFWNGSTDMSHSFYVGSYGRHTAINTSDIDILVKLPKSEYERYDSLKGNGQSRLLQGVKESILQTYSQSDVHADGQVVIINFSDGMIFEILPAFEEINYMGEASYTYPDTNKGGKWRSTDPKAEINAMAEKNEQSQGLFYDTCKHIRYIRDNYFSSYTLSGIIIDTFVYHEMKNWRWVTSGENCSNPGDYEAVLLNNYNMVTGLGIFNPRYLVPGSGMEIIFSDDDTKVLGKVLRKMVE